MVVGDAQSRNEEELGVTSARATRATTSDAHAEPSAFRTADQFETPTKKIIMEDNPMFPLETKAMKEVFRKEESKKLSPKRHKSVKLAAIKSVLKPLSLCLRLFGP